MKRKTLLVFILSVSILSTAVTGCSVSLPFSVDISEKTINDSQETEEPAANVSDDNKEDASSGLNRMSVYGEPELPVDYAQPVYLVEKDHIFEYECSEDVGTNAYKTFCVFDTLDDVLSPQNKYNFASCSYENGKLKVSPADILLLDENGSSQVNNGTWGDLNKFYLVQYMDLETGQDLEKPIVTPFTVSHDLDAPNVYQTVSPDYQYQLSWDAVPGAVEYDIYVHFGNAYEKQCTTSNTSETVSEFKDQQKSDNYEQLLSDDLEAAGYEQKEGQVLLNEGVRFSDGLEHTFVVVAKDAAGNKSGISNFVDVSDIANRIPYKISNNFQDFEISTPEDAPVYCDVEMVDGSISQMLLNYHGAQTYRFEDDPNKIMIGAKVYNADFDVFFMTLHGVSYDDFMTSAADIAKRQDDLNHTNGATIPKIVVPQAPSREETSDDKKAKESVTETMDEVPVSEDEEPSAEQTAPVEEEPTESVSLEEIPNTDEEIQEIPSADVEEIPEGTEQENSSDETETPSEQSTDLPANQKPPVPTVQAVEKASRVYGIYVPEQAPENAVVTPEGYTTYDLYLSQVQQVTNTLSQLGDVTDILFANSSLEAWIAYCLIAQQDIICVPTCIYPEAANTDYLTAILTEAYRQNPTSGVLAGGGYSYGYECLTVDMCEDAQTRLNRASAEIEKARSIAASVTKPDMSDTDKIFAINDYLCENASYDYNSCATDVDMYSLSQSFIDAHTPYGILCNNYGVCESYSEAFALIGRISGLDIAMETGTLQGGGHEWNRAFADGVWCVVDVTNNDMELTKNALLNVSESQMNGVLIPDGTSYFESLTAVDESKEYYYMNDKLATDAESAVSILLSQLDSSSEAQVRLPSGTSSQTATSIAQSVATQSGISSANYFAGVLAVKK